MFLEVQVLPARVIYHVSTQPSRKAWYFHKAGGSALALAPSRGSGGWHGQVASGDPGLASLQPVTLFDMRSE